MIFVMYSGVSLSLILSRNEKVV